MPTVAMSKQRYCFIPPPLASQAICVRLRLPVSFTEHHTMQQAISLTREYTLHQRGGKACLQQVLVKPTSKANLPPAQIIIVLLVTWHGRDSQSNNASSRIVWSLMRSSPVYHAAAAPEAAEPGFAAATPAGHTVEQPSVAALADCHALQQSSPAPESLSRASYCI